MALDHHEVAFDDAIEHHLLGVAGYAKADPASSYPERAAGKPREYRTVLTSAAVTGKIKVNDECGMMSDE